MPVSMNESWFVLSLLTYNAKECCRKALNPRHLMTLWQLDRQTNNLFFFFFDIKGELFGDGFHRFHTKTSFPN